MPPRGDTRNGQQNSLLLHLQLDTVPMYNGDRISGRCASGKLQAPPLPEMKLDCPRGRRAEAWIIRRTLRNLLTNDFCYCYQSSTRP